MSKFGVRFVNEKREIGSTVEGLGDAQIIWRDYEVLCPCGCWTPIYGEVSAQVGDDPNMQEWLCPTCIAEAEAE